MFFLVITIPCNSHIRAHSDMPQNDSVFHFYDDLQFRYGVINLVQLNISEAYAILQYSMIVVAVEIESKVM